MGEVYKARDTKLDREVAIKVLPAALARDPERLARFEREAKVLASLSHPNIAQIYGIEETDAGRALVMELVSGQTLKGPLSLGEALRIAGQIADALEAAHDRGIIHRDLKPANIMTTPAGVVKVLDFGLAAVTQPAAAGNGDPNNSPTLTMGATQAGMILGTAGYMAPEQAAGQVVDRRADIWAFGVVLWEMLTGQRLFTGDTIAHVLADVLTKEPEWERVPLKVRRLLRACLQKEPKQRLQAIGDWKLTLDEPQAPIENPRGNPTLPWILALVALVALATLAFFHFREAPAETPVIRTTILHPGTAAGGQVAISSDGRTVAFAGRGVDGADQLWVRPLDAAAAQALPGTNGASYPFWSPDGKSLGFFAGGKLKRINSTGGPALALADADGRGGTWSQDGVIVFTPARNTPLLKIPAGGGAPSPVTKLGPEDISHRLPWFLPDGRHFLYAATKVPNTFHTTIHVRDLNSSDDKVVGSADSNAIYVRGYLMFMRESNLMAQPFDPARLAVTGDAVPVAEAVQRVSISAYGEFSAAANGTLVYRGGAAATGIKLAWLDRNNKLLSTLGDAADILDLCLSPDGKSVAVTIQDHTTGNGDIWIYDVARGTRTRFTFDAGSDQNPIWSPDGRTIVFASDRKGHLDLYRKPSDGSANEELLYSDTDDKQPASWSPDGKYLMYRVYNPHSAKGASNLWLLPLDPQSSPPKPLPFQRPPFSAEFADFSPDGHWVAYQSGESGQPQIYIVPFPGAGGKLQISKDLGTFPRWRRDGKEIFFFSALSGRVLGAAIMPRGNFLEVGDVRELVGPILGGGGAYTYDVTADGQRFLVLYQGQQAADEPLTLVQNWAAGLKK
jgi:WD40 repeat protein